MTNPNHDRRPAPMTNLAAILLVAVGALATPAAGQQPAEQPARPPEHVFGERIEVHRLTVDVRVVNGRGEPVTGLTAADFEVELRGEPVEVEAADWRPAGEPAPGAGEPAAAETADAPPPEPGERTGPAPAAPARGLVVIFLQSADFYMQTFAVGHMRLLPKIERLIGELAPGEKAAVLRYGSKLELEMDFTADRDRLRGAVRHALFRIGEPPEPAVRPRPSLAAHLDAEAARRAATPARGLAVAGEALAAIPGAKTMVFVGWGLLDAHRRTGVGGRGSDGSDAIAALGAARTSVFVLDVVSADYHLLEGGLRYMAHVTGGTYSNTFHFPGGAVRQVERALTGSYTLVLRAPRLGPGRHPLKVRLAPQARRFGRTLLAPTGIHVTVNRGRRGGS